MHHRPAVVAPHPVLPAMKLARGVGRWLAGQRRIGGAKPSSIGSVAGRTGWSAIDGAPIEMFTRDRSRRTRAPRGDRHGCVVPRESTALAGLERLGDRRHDRVRAAGLGIVQKLLFDVAGGETGKPGRDAVALARRTVTGHAGLSRAARPAAKGDDLGFPRIALRRGITPRASLAKQQGKAADQTDGDQTPGNPSWSAPIARAFHSG